MRLFRSGLQPARPRYGWDDDCRYWGLDADQKARYLRRLSRYHGAQARWHADRAVRLARIGQRWAYCSLAFAGLALLLGLLAGALA